MPDSRLPRALLYCRLARTDLLAPGHTDEKMERYVRDGHDQAACHGLQIAPADIYIKAGASGGSLTGRPKMRQILRMAAAGEFTHLISYDLDRVSRGDIADEQEIEDALCAGAITLITQAEVIRYDPIDYDSLPADVRSLLARQERRKYIQRLKDSNRDRQERGVRSAGMAPYGYEWVKARYELRRLVTPGHYRLRADLEVTAPSAAQEYAQHQAEDCLTPEGALLSDRYLALAARQGLPGGALLLGITCTGGEYAILCELFRRLRSEGFAVLTTDLNARGIPPPSAARFAEFGGT